MRYRVADTPFNRHWYADIIGKVYDTPPAYAAVEEIGVVPMITEQILQAIADKEVASKAGWIASQGTPADRKVYLDGFRDGMETMIARIRQYHQGEYTP